MRNTRITLMFNISFAELHYPSYSSYYGYKGENYTYEQLPELFKVIEKEIQEIIRIPYTVKDIQLRGNTSIKVVLELETFKINGIPVNAQEMKKAIKATIKKHEEALNTGKSYKDYYCPLCSYDLFIRKRCKGGIACFACPWLIFEGCECKEEEYLDDKKSIERLNRWLRQLEEYSDD
jgi:hypothetical protein